MSNIYSFQFKAAIWATRKLSGFNDRKRVHISNMNPFSIVEARGFGAAEIAALNWKEYMTHVVWTVDLVGQAKKAFKELPIGPRESLVSLIMELESIGPIRHNWPNFSKFKGKDNTYHCH